MFFTIDKFLAQIEYFQKRLDVLESEIKNDSDLLEQTDDEMGILSKGIASFEEIIKSAMDKIKKMREIIDY